MDVRIEMLVVQLFNVNGLKFGEFFMRNGEVSPVYIDMRVIWTYPDIIVSNMITFNCVTCFLKSIVIAWFNHNK